MIANCLPPVIDKNCKIIILGSMPSVISRKINFYYANPANRFWKTLSSIVGEDFCSMSNEEKKSALLKHNIAMSDVFSTCEISGSLDANIKNYTFNDIPNLIKKTNIKTIYITSKFAYDAFMKKFGAELCDINIVNLPSPSGANRSKFKTDGDLLFAWKNLLKI